MRTNLTQHAEAVNLYLQQERRPSLLGILHYYFAVILFILSFSLGAQTIPQQGFESTPTDTWSYTANPSPSRLVWWGTTDQPIGGATAQAGNLYWASWDLDMQSHALIFDTLTLNPGYIHTLSFYYFTKNLNSTTEFSRYCVQYDAGENWDNWITLQANTDAWTLVSVEVPAYTSTLRLKVEALYDGLSKYAHWDSFRLQRAPAPPLPPNVTNITATQRTDGSKLIDIYYDLFDANNDLSDITVKLSGDNGSNYDILPSPVNLSGDFGDDLPIGINKHIIWDAGSEGYAMNGYYPCRIFADDGSSPSTFVLVEGGTFYNGTSNVTVSSFYLDKYEMTQAGYQAVMGYNPASGFGVGGNYPVYWISWFKAIEYCNRRSMQEGLTPCYSYGSLGTNPDTWDFSSYDNHINFSCDWTAWGYRLPTEAEWVFAARGGNLSQGYSYSGSNNAENVGWIHGNSDNPPGPRPVGIKPANELGLYDMTGNVWEWVWDIYGSYPSNYQTNPHGAASGSKRVYHGGGFATSSSECSIRDRRYDYATFTNYQLGFRICRIAP